jgi:hypothetical protein
VKRFIIQIRIIDSKRVFQLPPTFLRDRRIPIISALVGWRF